MSEISPVNTSFYSELLEGFAPTSLQAIARVGKDTPSGLLASNSYPDVKAENVEVNLNDYYADSKFENWLTKVGNTVVSTAGEMNNSIINAIQNGYTVQDACKVKSAEIAYKASVQVFDVAEEISTFALDV